MTYFSQAKHTFNPVPEDKEILAESFLNACSEIVPFFDLLGSTAFAPVKSDINGNIGKLRSRLDPAQGSELTLQGIVQKEIDAKTTTVKNSATDALLWLKRALSFIRIFFEEVLSMEPELNKCVNKAYSGSLKKFHGWIVQKMFSVAMMAVPYRTDFIKALGKDCCEEEVLKDMRQLVTLMAANIDVINEFYEQNGLEKSDKV